MTHDYFTFLSQFGYALRELVMSYYYLIAVIVLILVTSELSNSGCNGTNSIVKVRSDQEEKRRSTHRQKIV